MFGISFSNWTSICQAYRELNVGSKKAALQWYPLSILSDDDWDYICGKDFYNDYIGNGTFVMIPEIMHLSDNYIQKGDGSFRDSTLISPVLYLILQAIEKEIASNFKIYYFVSLVSNQTFRRFF